MQTPAILCIKLRLETVASARCSLLQHRGKWCHFGTLDYPIVLTTIYASIPHYHWFVTLKSHNGFIDLKKRPQ
jgi:hypothetical protein